MDKQSDPSPSGVSLYGTAVEYGLHSILWLIEPRAKPVSSRDLAAFSGISAALVAKIMPKLEKAGLVTSVGGIHGGYRLARAADSISMLDVIVAIDGHKSLFDCKNIRQHCVMFSGNPPAWFAGGTCGIHAVMIRAEKRMREELAKTSILKLATGVSTPAGFFDDVGTWFDERANDRETARLSAVKTSSRGRRATKS